MASSDARKARRAAKFGHPIPETTELKRTGQAVTEEKPAESGKSPEIIPVAEKSQGEGVRKRLSDSGVRIGSEQRMLARAVNWQQKNRFPLELAVVDEKLVEATGDQPQIYDEILVNAVTLMRSNNLRAKSIGVRAGAQLAKLVQSDDHAKLRAELRPTALAPQVIIDQSTHNDNRRVVFTIPNNGRDPAIHVALPVSMPQAADNPDILNVVSE
jgi:hypothetical protein